MKYTASEIAKIVGGELILGKAEIQVLRHLLYDSRKVNFPESSLFFAFSGTHQNGHQYLEELIEKGVQNFVISKKPKRHILAKGNFILVKNVLGALQQLGAHHRRLFQIPIIGITGSNGKTIIKEWLFQVLKDNYQIVRSPQSFNSQIGVPLSVCQIEKTDNLGIIEAGISQPREMEKLAKIIQPTLGIFTNIGAAHSAGFRSTKQKIREKLRLFKNTETLIYCSDHSAIQEGVQKYFKGQTFYWSAQHSAPFFIKKIQATKNGTTKINGVYNHKNYYAEIPFTDPAAIENAIHVWATCLYLQLPIRTIKTRLAQLESVAMRLELKNGIHDSLLINDSYSADLNSLANALHFTAQQGKARSRTVILSDILEHQQSAASLYRNVAELLKSNDIDQFIGIGSAILQLKKNLPKGFNAQFYPTTSAFLDQLTDAAFRHQVILLKGARSFRFEQIANRLAEKVHQTKLEINLSALTHNLKIYRQLLHPQTKIMVMVKAAAYGIGSTEIARLLEYQQIHYLAVAYTDEGIALREAGIQLPIVVLNPEPDTLESMVRHQLEPEIYSLPQLKELIQLTGADQRPKDTLKLHLNFDTGMNRLGMKSNDIDHLVMLLKTYPALRVQSAFTHLAASETPKHDAFTHQQMTEFEEIYQQLTRQIGYQPDQHALNSAGISRFPQYQQDMVRLGIGLYGYDSSQTTQSQLATVHTLKASISQIKMVPPGQSVGYGRAFVVTEARRIATISIGYADGLLRRVGNGCYQVSLRDVRVPIVGQVCMDMCMLDISEVPEAQVGDEVIIFGPELPVTELASAMDTIVYEVFTLISERVKRVYIQD